MEEKFVNRDNNFLQFDQYLNKSIQYNVPFVSIVYGKSGVGKSFFAKELLLRYYNYIGIKVVVPTINNTPENYYIERIAQSIDGLSPANNYPSFFSFFKKKSNQRKGKKYIESLKNIILDEHIIGKLIKETIDFVSLENQDEIKQKLFSSKSSDIQILLKEYISYIVCNYMIILNIENIHNIDAASLDYLNDFVPNSLQSVFIFEYTISHETDERKGVSEIYNIFSDLLQFQEQSKLFFAATYLEKLSKEDVYKIIEQYGISEAFDSLFVNYDGDLRLLKHLQLTYQRDKSLFSRVRGEKLDYRRYHLEHIDKDQLYILALIIVHKGILPYDQLYFIYEYKKTQSLLINIDDEIQKLVEEDLIIVNKDSHNIYIKHDSTSESFSSNKEFQRIRHLAYNTWINYYENILSKAHYAKVTEENALTMLFHFYFNHIPQRLEALFSRIKDYIFKNIVHPISARNFIYPLVENLDSKTKNYQKNCLEIVNLFYSLHMYNDAHEVLRKANSKDEKYNLFLSAILNRKGNNEASLDFIEKQQKKKLSPRLNLIFNTIKLVSLRSLNRFEEMLNCYEEIISNENILTKEIEYGFFLRISEVCLSPELAVKNILKSIKFFDKDDLERSNSQVTLSILYIRSGRLTEAKNLLESAKIYLSSRITEKHVINNNLAVINLYNNDINEETEQLLLDALITGIGSFNRIVILNNLLIYYCKINNQNQATICVEKISNLIKKEADKALHRTCYYNIAYFYKSFENEQLATSFLNKAILEHQAIVNETTLFWNDKLGISNTYNGFFNFLIKNNYYLPTISNWGIPVNFY